MKKINSFCLIALSLISARPVWALTNQKSFTPTKFLYPITEILLMRDDGLNTQVLYQCPGGTPESCMVDLADTNGAALQAISAAVQNVSVAAGTYTQMKLNNCPATTAATTVTVRGTASVGAGPLAMATRSTGMAVGTSASDAVLNWTCGGAFVRLVTPAIVTNGSVLSFNLLVDLTNSVWTDPSATSGTGGCLTGSGGSQSLCAANPLIVPYFGVGTPTFERYYIAHSTFSTSPQFNEANATVNLGVDPSGTVFYAGVQPYYTENSPASGEGTKGSPNYNSLTRSLTINANGTIAFQTGISSVDNRVGFTAFKRASHFGTCRNESADSTVWNYQAFKQ